MWGVQGVGCSGWTCPASGLYAMAACFIDADTAVPHWHCRLTLTLLSHTDTAVPHWRLPRPLTPRSGHWVRSSGRPELKGSIGIWTSSLTSLSLPRGRTITCAVSVTTLFLSRWPFSGDVGSLCRAIGTGPGVQCRDSRLFSVQRLCPQGARQ